MDLLRPLRSVEPPDRVGEPCDTTDALHAGTLSSSSNPVDAGTRPARSARETVKCSGIGGEWCGGEGDSATDVNCREGALSEGAVQLQGCWLLIYYSQKSNATPLILAVHVRYRTVQLERSCLVEAGSSSYLNIFPICYVGVFLLITSGERRYIHNKPVFFPSFHEQPLRLASCRSHGRQGRCVLHSKFMRRQ